MQGSYIYIYSGFDIHDDEHLILFFSPCFCSFTKKGKSRFCRNHSQHSFPQPMVFVGWKFLLPKPPTRVKDFHRKRLEFMHPRPPQKYDGHFFLLIDVCLRLQDWTSKFTNRLFFVFFSIFWSFLSKDYHNIHKKETQNVQMWEFGLNKNNVI